MTDNPTSQDELFAWIDQTGICGMMSDEADDFNAGVCEISLGWADVCDCGADKYRESLSVKPKGEPR